jgi:pimeloyl-ACP methyl ester carboxylesterase
MGSRLKESGPNGRVLWNEHLPQNLHLLSNPSVLRLQQRGKTLKAESVIHTATVPLRFFKKIDICRILRKELMNMASSTQLFNYHEFPYDWRLDLIETAAKLGLWLEQCCGFKKDGNGKQLVEDNPRLALVCHSMGGVLGAIAIRSGFINPANVDRFVTIGTPFTGAPAAFRGLYDLSYLPGLNFFDRILNWRLNRIDCRRRMSETFQSFVTPYQLLPPVAENFVELNPGVTINPLTRSIIPADKKNAAAAAHQLLDGLDVFLDKYPNLRYLFIFGDDSNTTDSRFRASENTTEETYDKIRVSSLTNGDKTVPKSSATLKKPKANGRFPVGGVSHISMCEDKRVWEEVKAFLKAKA